jgi:hypothetical protein
MTVKLRPVAGNRHSSCASGVVLGTRAAALACLLGAAPAGCFADVVAPSYGESTDDAGPATVSTHAVDSPGSASILTADAGGPTGQGSVPDGGNGGESDAGATTPVGCDLSGRWIATDREVATGLGATEAAHTWLYFELGQSGTGGTVTKGLDCGRNVRGISSVAANVDYPKTWPALLANDTQTGRKFTSTTTASGCAVSFEKRYTVVGATVSFFTDPSQKMPTASQQATSTIPGWEDWDHDGNPGYTMNVTGLATGQLYMSTRAWNVWSGTVATGAAAFKLKDDWNSEADVLGINGSSLLTAATSATRDNDPTLHFVEFARLGATQATGDDASTCAAIRMLAASLTPNAAN